MKAQSINLQETYMRVVDLWQLFCDKHNQLFQLTCDEYSYLLGSKIEQLEQVIEQKTSLMDEIQILEGTRKEIIAELNLHMNKEDEILSVGDLLLFMQDYEKHGGQSYLRRYNDLLVDIIEKIQEQNKRNQIFINKSLLALKDIREGLLGVKNYNTYNSLGITERTGKK